MLSNEDDDEVLWSFVNGELVTFYRQWSFGDSVAGQWRTRCIARIHYPRHKSLQESLNAVQCRKTILGSELGAL